MLIHKFTHTHLYRSSYILRSGPTHKITRMQIIIGNNFFHLASASFSQTHLRAQTDRSEKKREEVYCIFRAAGAIKRIES